MMSETDSHSSAEANFENADWRQLEAFVDELYASAQAPITEAEFYHQLLTGCVTLMAAEGGAVWLPAGGNQWRKLHQVNDVHLPSGDITRRALLHNAAQAKTPQILLPKSNSANGLENPTDKVIALCAVTEVDSLEPTNNAHALIELFLRPGSSPEVQQGWLELLTTVSQAASEFHLHDQLRRLRAERGLYNESLAFSHRIQQSTDLRKIAFEIVNEGRKFVATDRLSLVMRRRSWWQLLAVSGVDRIEKRSDTAKQLQKLAAAISSWGEPLEYSDLANYENPLEDIEQDTPPELTQLITQHIDQSQARQLVAVPVVFEQEKTVGHTAAVLVAEQFSSEASDLSQQRVIELASLCEPALRQAQQLDRFPIRNLLQLTNRWARLWERQGLIKLSLTTIATLAVLASLIFVKHDFEIEAPATLAPIVERNVFATADGKVTEVQVTHGQLVEAGQVLAVLQDPQLALESQRAAGEITTTRKRLEAIAVARTDRQVREDSTSEKLPLSAEAEQLRKRLASLQIQKEILEDRHQALTLRSPIAGTVLTLDIQNLLRTRPVKRGEVLFTVADTTVGWRLLTEVAQDQIGHIVAAQKQLDDRLPTRFRLAGDIDRTYSGRVESISTTAILDTADLDQASPTFEVVVAVNDRILSEARPGMNAQVRIHCGNRSLGYIWLHDIWETIYSWWVF